MNPWWYSKGQRMAAGTAVSGALGIRQLFCTHKESFAYRRYGDFDFTEYCSCRRCGKTLRHFSGFDEDIRG